MATIFSYALIGITLGRLPWPGDRRQQRIGLHAATLAMLPDIDVPGFPLGIHQPKAAAARRRPPP